MPTNGVSVGNTGPRSTRPGRRRLGVEGHRQFVTTIAGELEVSMAGLVDTVHDLVADQARPADVAGFNRQAQDIARLVNVLLAFDGPASRRRPRALSLGAVMIEAAQNLDLRVEVAGRPGGERTIADAAVVRTGIELLLLGLAGADQVEPVQVRIVNEDLAIIDGTVDPSDERRNWQLRYGRRILEGEGFELRSSVTPSRYRVEVRAGH